MIFGKKYVFLELAKTGSTYARYVLMLLGNSDKVGKKHNVYNSLSSAWKLKFDESVKMASIRNPYDYYVSLFGFTCSGRGGLYYRSTIRPDYLSFYHPGHLFYMSWEFLRFRSRWKETYMDVNSKDHFKRFIFLLLEENPTASGFHYGLSDVHKFIGYYSHDFLRMCTKDYIEHAPSFKNKESIKSHLDNHYLIDIMLRNESLKEDLLKHAFRIGMTREQMQAAIDSKPPRSNTASKHRPYQEYYDDETIALVTEREKLIIDKFNYDFE